MEHKFVSTAKMPAVAKTSQHAIERLNMAIDVLKRVFEMPIFSAFHSKYKFDIGMDGKDINLCDDGHCDAEVTRNGHVMFMSFCPPRKFNLTELEEIRTSLVAIINKAQTFLPNVSIKLDPDAFAGEYSDVCRLLALYKPIFDQMRAKIFPDFTHITSTPEATIVFYVFSRSTNLSPAKVEQMRIQLREIQASMRDEGVSMTFIFCHGEYI